MIGSWTGMQVFTNPLGLDKLGFEQLFFPDFNYTLGLFVREQLPGWVEGA